MRARSCWWSVPLRPPVVSQVEPLPDRDGLLDALMAMADKVIKLDASTLYLEKSVKGVHALPVVSRVEPPRLDASVKVAPRRRCRG